MPHQDFALILLGLAVLLAAWPVVQPHWLRFATPAPLQPLRVPQQAQPCYSRMTLPHRSILLRTADEYTLAVATDVRATWSRVQQRERRAQQLAQARAAKAARAADRAADAALSSPVLS